MERVIFAFPPARFSYELSKLSHAFLTIGRKKIADSIFPDEVLKKDGYVLIRPDLWK